MSIYDEADEAWAAEADESTVLPLHPASGIIIRDGKVSIRTASGGLPLIKSQKLAAVGQALTYWAAHQDQLVEPATTPSYASLCMLLSQSSSEIQQATSELCEHQVSQGQDVVVEGDQYGLESIPNCYDCLSVEGCAEEDCLDLEGLCTFSAGTCMPVGGVQYPLGIDTQKFKAAFSDISRLLFGIPQTPDIWAETQIDPGTTCSEYGLLTPTEEECELFGSSVGLTESAYNHQHGTAGTGCKVTSTEIIYTSGTNAGEELACEADNTETCICKKPYTLQIDVDTDWIGDPQRFDAFMRASLSEYMEEDGAYFKFPTFGGTFSTLQARLRPAEESEEYAAYISPEQCLARDEESECDINIWPPNCVWNAAHGVCQKYDIECAFPEQWDCEDVNVPIIWCNPYHASSSSDSGEGSDSGSDSDSGMPVWAIVLVAAGVGVPAVYLLYAFSQKRWPFGGEVGKGAYARIDGLLY